MVLASDRHAGAAVPRLNALVRWAFYLFIASIPFEGLDIGPLEPTFFTAGFLIVAALTQPRECFRVPARAFWYFAIYLYICVALGLLFGSDHREDVTRQLVIHVQLMLLFWIAMNVFRDEQVARKSLFALIGACTLLSVLQLAGVTSGVAATARVATERVTAMGENPNTIARVLALALLALIGLTYGADRSFIRPPILVVPLFGLIGITIIQTGSRGGLLALGAGLMCYMAQGRSVGVRMRNMLVVAAGIGFFLLISYQTESVRNRFLEAVDQGDLAKRELIFPLAVQMISEKPVFGWGPINDNFELGDRLRQPGYDRRDAHNLILAVLVKTGIVGFIPFLYGTLLAVSTAWRSRAGPHGILAFAMLMALLVANMSSSWLFKKLHWIVLAYALAVVFHHAKTAWPKKSPTAAGGAPVNRRRVRF